MFLKRFYYSKLESRFGYFKLCGIIFNEVCKPGSEPKAQDAELVGYVFGPATVMEEIEKEFIEKYGVNNERR